MMKEREPGKRKIKPAETPYNLLDLIDTSSDDEEYLPNECDNNDDDDGNDESSDSGDDSSDESEQEEDIESNDLKANSKDNNLSKIIPKIEPQNDINSNNLSHIKFDLASRVPKLLVCSVCLGDQSLESDEIVECDSCGMTVHEGCYGISNENDGDDVSIDSNASSSSTEPWFCDSCLANIQNPVCDLCPNIGTIYKQTDVKRWVHLVCALYIPGVAFADTTRLTGVTLFELSYDRWGSKECILCEDERLSRTGICISCDAGMCRTYFHVTCALAHGLLSEAQNGDETELVDPFYAHCKVHASDKAAVKSKRKNWLALQSKLKIRLQNHSVISERTQKKLNLARVKWAKDNELKSPPWVPTQKVPRLLTTSSSAVRRLIKKAELLGLSPQAQYLASNDVLDIRKKWHIPPAFSQEFICYYLDRNNRISSMQKRLEELQTQYKQLKSAETTRMKEYEDLTAKLEEYKSKNSFIKSKFLSLWSKLGILSSSSNKLTVPKIIDSIDKRIDKREGSESRDKSDSNSTDHATSVLTKCGICQQLSGYHLMAHCDSCKFHFHCECLDPPLLKVPKKTRFGGWQCSDCTEKEEEAYEREHDMNRHSSASEDETNSEVQTNESRKRRKLRDKVRMPDKFIPDAAVENSCVKTKKKNKTGNVNNRKRKSSN